MVDPYELVPEPRKPSLPGSVVLRSDLDEVIDAAAADLMVQATTCVRSFGDFHLALSGGALLEKLYMRLMVDPAFRMLPWTRTHVWFTHEAGVGAEDGGTYSMVRETILEHADIPASQVHPMLPRHAEARESYERDLREHLEWREKGHDRLDFVIFESDADGGLSGIPAGDVAGDGAGVEESEPGVLVREAGDGLRLTRGMINASRLVGVLAVGESVRPLVSRVERGDVHAGMPVGWIRPMAGVARWYIDHGACPDGGADDSPSEGVGGVA